MTKPKTSRKIEAPWNKRFLSIGAVILTIWGILGLLALPNILKQDWATVRHVWALIQQDPGRYALPTLFAFMGVITGGMCLAGFLYMRKRSTEPKKKDKALKYANRMLLA